MFDGLSELRDFFRSYEKNCREAFPDARPNDLQRITRFCLDQDGFRESSKMLCLADNRDETLFHFSQDFLVSFASQYPNGTRLRRRAAIDIAPLPACVSYRYWE